MGGGDLRRKGGWKGPDLCYRFLWSPLSFSLSLRALWQRANIKKGFALRQNQCLVKHKQLTLPFIAGLTGEWGAQVRGYEIFSSGEGLAGL